MVKPPNDGKKTRRYRRSTPYDRRLPEPRQREVSPPPGPSNRLGEGAAAPKVDCPEAVPGTSSASYPYERGYRNDVLGHPAHYDLLAPLDDSSDDDDDDSVNKNGNHFPIDENQNYGKIRVVAWAREIPEEEVSENVLPPSPEFVVYDEVSNSSDCSTLPAPEVAEELEKEDDNL